jgi:hypothetical protein
MLAFNLRFIKLSIYNTKINTPFQPKLSNKIKYIKVKWLSKGF